MGHPGNWSDRKKASVRADNVRADREALKTATFEEHGTRGWKFREMHPCYAYGMRFIVHATCMGCLEKRYVDLVPLQHSPLAHAFFPRIMASLTCSACGSCAASLHFQRQEGPRLVDHGVLLARTDRTPPAAT